MPVVAIDGPAGSGKSTIARALAKRLAVPHVDTGAYYRAVTLAALEAGIDVTDGSALAALAGRIVIDRVRGHTYVDGRDAEEAIRSAAVDAAVSAVAAHPAVRQRLLERQRQAVTAAGGVVEGRDAGTKVVPSADLKIWLTATPQVRAERRAAERAAATGRPVDRAAVAAHTRALIQRDRSDAVNMERAVDVRVIDTSHARIDDVVENIVQLLEARA